jgi:hypothetical protein
MQNKEMRETGTERRRGRTQKQKTKKGRITRRKTQRLAPLHSKEKE